MFEKRLCQASLQDVARRQKPNDDALLLITSNVPMSVENRCNGLRRTSASKRLLACEKCTKEICLWLRRSEDPDVVQNLLSIFVRRHEPTAIADAPHATDLRLGSLQTLQCVAKIE